MKRAVVVLMLVLAAASACKKKSSKTTNVADVENKVAARQVQLFYESGQSSLTAEQRTLPLPENPAAALPIIVKELARGPAAPTLARILPQDCVIRGAFLLAEGTAIIDLGGPTFSEGWPTGSHQELLAIQSIAHTVTTNIPEAKRVRLLVNGSPAETLGGHIALRRSFAPSAAALSGQPAVVPPAGAKPPEIPVPATPAAAPAPSPAAARRPATTTTAPPAPATATSPAAPAPTATQPPREESPAPETPAETDTAPAPAPPPPSTTA